MKTIFKVLILVGVVLVFAVPVRLVYENERLHIYTNRARAATLTADNLANALATSPENETPPEICQKWFRAELPDPWGEQFTLEQRTGAYRVRSSGPDRKTGTKDDVLGHWHKIVRRK